VLVRGGSHARYVSSGHLVYTVGRALYAVPFDRARLQTRGTAVPVLPRLATFPQGRGLFSVSAAGTLAYVDSPAADAFRPVTMVWVDRRGREEPLGAPPGLHSFPRLSPDGKRVAVGNNVDIFIWDVVRQTLNQLTLDPGLDFFPAWMPDSLSSCGFSAE
jgi:hypothetical protein